MPIKIHFVRYFAPVDFNVYEDARFYNPETEHLCKLTFALISEDKNLNVSDIIDCLEEIKDVEVEEVRGDCDDVAVTVRVDTGIWRQARKVIESKLHSLLK